MNPVDTTENCCAGKCPASARCHAQVSRRLWAVQDMLQGSSTKYRKRSESAQRACNHPSSDPRITTPAPRRCRVGRFHTYEWFSLTLLHCNHRCHTQTAHKQQTLFHKVSFLFIAYIARYAAATSVRVGSPYHTEGTRPYSKKHRSRRRKQWRRLHYRRNPVQSDTHARAHRSQSSTNK